MIRRRYNAIPPNGNNANHALSVVECGGGDVRVRMLNKGTEDIVEAEIVGRDIALAASGSASR